MTAHANNKELIADHSRGSARCRSQAACRTCWSSGWPSTATTSSGSPCTSRTTWRRPTIPPAAEALLAEVAKVGSLQIPLAALTEAAAEVRAKIDEQVECQHRGRSSGGGTGAPVRCVRRSPGEPVAAGTRRGSAQRRGTRGRVRTLPRAAVRETPRTGSKTATTTRSRVEAGRRPEAEVARWVRVKPNLRPVRDVQPTLQFRTIHGYRRAFRVAGSGPALLLIHGIGDNSTTWERGADQARAAVHRHRARPAGSRKVRQAARGLLGGRLRQRHARPAQPCSTSNASR